MKRFLPILAGAMASGTFLSAAEEESVMNLMDPALLGFGPPGFKAVMTASGAMDFEDGGGSVQSTEARVLVPVWGKDFGEGSVFGTGVSYGLTSLDLDGALGLQRQDLQTLMLQATFAHFPTSHEGWMGLAIVSAGLATDFNEIDGDDFALATVLVGGYQFNPRFTLAAAVAYFHSVGDDTVVPGLGVIWQPNDQWIVQLTPPIVGVGWSPDRCWTFSLSAYPGGGAWDVDQEGTNSQVEAIKLEGWRAGLGVERRIGEHWRVNAQVGMNFGGELDLHDSGGDTLFKRDLDPSLFGLLGVAWTF